MGDKVFAHTLPGSNYPAYINVKIEPSNGDRSRRLALEGDDWLVVAVRSEAGEDGACGATAKIKLTRHEAVTLCDGIYEVLAP